MPPHYELEASLCNIQKFLRGLRDEFNAIAKRIVYVATPHAGDVVGFVH